MSFATTLTKKAPAKINLYLEVSAKRPDGYHDIESVMQTVTLFDTLTLTRRGCDGEDIIIGCGVSGVPLDKKNLVFRAAEAFFERTGITHRDITFTIDKVIPMAAGLGGGSSDAAAALILLNELFATSLQEDELCQIGAKIGADIPFLIRQGISVTRGIGDVFSPCVPLPDCFIVIALAGEGVSTPWAYGQLDLMYNFAARHVSAGDFAEIIQCGDIKKIAQRMTNIFESVVLPCREAARDIKRSLEALGAEKAMMSGSGPSVFGIFADENAANSAANSLKQRGIQAFVTTPYYPAP